MGLRNFIFEKDSVILFPDSQAKARVTIGETKSEQDEAGEEPKRREEIKSEDLKGPKEETRYAFLKTGPTWKIVFDGCEISGLKGKGFDYLHYLMDNCTKEFNNIELYEGVSGNVGLLDSEDGKPVTLRVEHITSNGKKQQIGDARGAGKLYKKLGELKGEYEREVDPLVKNEISEEITSIQKNLKENIRTIDDESKRIKNAIGQAIKRAIENLLAQDKKLGEHMQSAFKDPFANTKRYKPTENLPWIFR